MLLKTSLCTCGPRVIEENQLDYWQVTSEAGNDEVSVDLPEVEKDGQLHLKYNDVHLTVPTRKGQKKAVFKSVTLPKSKGNFHVYLKNKRLPVGPLFVDVKKVG